MVSNTSLGTPICPGISHHPYDILCVCFELYTEGHRWTCNHLFELLLTTV